MTNLSEKYPKLDRLIQDFSLENLEGFLYDKNLNSSDKEDFSHFEEGAEEYFSDTQKLGEIETDNERDRIFVVASKSKKELSERSSKKRQYELARKIIKGQNLEAVTFVFYDEKGDFYFSLIHAQYSGTTRSFNNFRRFNYFVSKEFSNKTFLKQIGEANFDSFENIKEAFSVAKVTKEFFDNYKELFEKLVEYLESDKAFSAFVGQRGIDLEDFSKKLLGQIVFLYFLQRKGWLGAKKGESINKGDKKFIRNLFDEKYGDYDNFFNDILEHLFYDALNKNTERAGSFYREHFNCQIPFLNGGLFEPINDYDWKTENLNIPDDIFSNEKEEGVLDVFDNYNFTVDENTADDQEVSVDPEMLGKVFENLLSDNVRRGQGAFYTPREIVQYMCRESLINYLVTESKIDEKQIRKLVVEDGAYSDKDLADLDENQTEQVVERIFFLNKKKAKEIDSLLKKIKVCDPACGSGAFLIGSLQEIVKARLFLGDWYLNENASEYDLKKETIQNCIYGVDIDPGAVDIAKLRFWLSIVVDNDIEDIEPLPNLDYKIMQGNSLLENLVVGNEVLEFDFESKKKLDGRTKDKKNLYSNTQAKLFYEKSETLVEKLEKYHTEYFSLKDPEKKRILKRKIDGIEDELIQSKCQEGIKKQENIAKNSLANEKKMIRATEQVLAIKAMLRKWKKDHIRPFFPWKLHFGEVFNEKGGFDIVIGNPPYVQLQKNGGELANMYQGGWFESFTRTGDIYVLFYEFGNKILRERGVLSFITSNKWMRAGYGEKLRKYLSENTTPKLLIDLGSGVFETATVDTNILIFQKGKQDEICKACSIKENLAKENIELVYYIKQNKVELSDFSAEAWIILSKIEQVIKTKIEKNGTQLKDWDIKINRGILTGYNKAFIIDGSKKDELIAKDPKSAEIIKPILRGRDIKRYSANFADLWLIATHNGYKKENGEIIEAVDIENYPAIKDWLDDHWDKIEKRQDKGATPYNLRNCTYQEEFKKEKIVWQEMVQKGNFLFDNKHMFCNDTGRIMTGRKIEYLLPILNSKLFFFAVKFFYGGGSLGEKGVRMKHTFFESFSVPKISQEEQKPFIEKANQILEMKKADKNADTSEIEKEIDKMVCELYGLTKDEIKIVEKG